MRVILLFLCVASLLASPPDEHRNRIRVPVWLGTTSEADPRPAAGAWSARLGGEPAQITAALGPEDGLVLLIVTDMVGDLTLVDTAKRALMERVQSLPKMVWTGLLRAQNGLRVIVDPTPKRERLVAAIQTLPVSGRAGLLESVQPAAGIGDAIQSKAATRVAVLFLTDSDIRNYREDYTNPVINGSDRQDMSRRFPDALIRERISKLETALIASETPLFIVHLAYRSEGLNEAYQSGLMRLASVTGGTSTFCRSQSEIPDAIGRTLDSILSHHSVEILVPEDAPRELEIAIESAGQPLEYRSRFTN